jgi:hypothetical protein
MSSDPEVQVVCVSKMCPVTHLPACFSARCKDNVVGQSLGVLDHSFYVEVVGRGANHFTRS